MEARFPYDPTPGVHHFPGDADSCFDLINQYGTYNIQPTADSDHIFPMIAPGLPGSGGACGWTSPIWSGDRPHRKDEATFQKAASSFLWGFVIQPSGRRA